MIKNIHIKNLTIFDNIKIELSPKINVIVGENASGKTHVLKALYAMSSHCKDSDSYVSNKDKRIWITERMNHIFLPLHGKIAALKNHNAKDNMHVEITYRDESVFGVKLDGKSDLLDFSESDGFDNSVKHNLSYPVYIPEKEMLSMMLGFRSLMERYQTSFDVSYKDIIVFLELPPLRDERVNSKVKACMQMIEDKLKGRFIFLGAGMVVFRTQVRDYSPNVMADGYCRLGMLYRLMETGALCPENGAPLLWDEPEAYLNPELMKLVAKILIDLSNEGQQIVIATRSLEFVICLNKLIGKNKGDQVVYHHLYRDGNDKIQLQSAWDIAELEGACFFENFKQMTGEDTRKDTRKRSS